MITETLLLLLLLLGILSITSASQMFTHRRKMPGSEYRMFGNSILYLILLLLAIGAFIFFGFLLLA